MQILNKQNVIKLQRTTCGDDCLGAARYVPSATIPAANRASTTPANSTIVEQGVVATGRESQEERQERGNRRKRENRRLVSYCCVFKGAEGEATTFPRGKVMLPQGPVKMLLAVMSWAWPATKHPPSCYVGKTKPSHVHCRPWRYMALNILSANSGQLSHVFPLPTFWHLLIYSLGGAEWETERPNTVQALLSNS